MGTDRKSKRTSPSKHEDEKKSKRPRTVEDEERKKRKREKKEKSKDNKSHKHSKEKSDKGKKDKHRSKHSKGDGQMEFQELSNDDYFAKNNEFAAWLKEEKKVFFSDLSSESARELFSGFVKSWNKGKLDSHYYEGIASGPRTSHNWNIKK